MIKAGEQRLGRKHANACCSELDRERQPIEPHADLRNGGGVVVREREASVDGLRTFDEQCDRFALRKRTRRLSQRAPRTASPQRPHRASTDGRRHTPNRDRPAVLQAPRATEAVRHAMTATARREHHRHDRKQALPTTHSLESSHRRRPRHRPRSRRCSPRSFELRRHSTMRSRRHGVIDLSSDAETRRSGCPGVLDR